MVRGGRVEKGEVGWGLGRLEEVGWGLRRLGGV